MANLFIPYEIRNAIETKRRELEGRIRGQYSGNPDTVRLFEAMDQDLLDMLEMIDMIVKNIELQEHP